MFEKRYVAWDVYSQSKLAMLMFGLELARRQRRVASITAHPGFARTNLIANGMGHNWLRDTVIGVFGNLFSQSAADGALPVLRAATDPALASGDYIGSVGLMELRGPPGSVPPPRQALDRADGEALWALAERKAGVTFRP